MATMLLCVSFADAQLAMPRVLDRIEGTPFGGSIAASATATWNLTSLARASGCGKMVLTMATYGYDSRS
jgi:hypothetical protein